MLISARDLLVRYFVKFKTFTLKYDPSQGNKSLTTAEDTFQTSFEKVHDNVMVLEKLYEGN